MNKTKKLYSNKTPRVDKLLNKKIILDLYNDAVFEINQKNKEKIDKIVKIKTKVISNRIIEAAKKGKLRGEFNISTYIGKGHLPSNCIPFIKEKIKKLFETEKINIKYTKNYDFGINGVFEVIYDKN